MNFESKLSKGKFCIPECQKCKKIVWPPAEFCSHCFGTVLLKQGEFEGKIIEFSRQGNQYFCIVEFLDTVKIMANISKTPIAGQTVKISECGIKDGSYFFQVS
ncbi:hypothetical protein K0U27_01590 [archaeon]|nr:hypothetical protein [archaeon]